MLTVDLFSIYLLSRVDSVIRYIEVDLTFGLPDYVRYIEVRYIEVRFHTFYCNFGRDKEYCSLYRGLRLIEPGSLNRSSTVSIVYFLQERVSLSQFEGRGFFC